MRILHVITSLKTGGAERLMVDLLPRLRDMGHVVELLLFNGVDTPFKQNLAKQGIKLYELFDTHDVKENSHVYRPLNVVKLKKYIQGGYDIIHTHNTACQLFVPIAKMLSCSKTIMVTTEHNTTNRRRDKRWFKPIDSWMYNQYAAIVCVSQQTGEKLKQYLDTKSNVIRTIHNGVDTERFIMPIKDIKVNSTFVITMVAAFREQKDHETVLKAMTLLPKNYTLQLVGYGSRFEQIKAECAKLLLGNRVSFLGNRSDVPELLGASDVVVMSSHWEGFGLAAVEGMASGRPLVASNVAGLSDVVSGAGVLFEHGNDKDLADKIQWLCGHPDEYRKVAQRCQERARQYDISVMAEEYNNLYKSLLTE